MVQVDFIEDKVETTLYLKQIIVHETKKFGRLTLSRVSVSSTFSVLGTTLVPVDHGSYTVDFFTLF